jgi:hypothetical protein
MATETWRPIAGHEGYEVSDRGRVRSLDRTVAVMRRGRMVMTRYRGRVLKPNPDHKGYLQACLGRHGRRARVHLLVLETFVGPRPVGHEAAHWDGDPRNNALANLRWCTRAENAEDRRRHGTLLVGARHPSWLETHCRRGHARSENTRRHADGGRYCGACQQHSERRRRAAAVIAAAQHTGTASIMAPGLRD